jgi:uncharacterized repeat protein (TIGR01451 family)
MTVVDKDDPVEVGGRTTYQITVTNQGSLEGKQVRVVAVIPEQMRLIEAKGPAVYQVQGSRVVFAPLDALHPGMSVPYTVIVEAVKPGDARFRAELTSDTLREPVVKEESTNVR